MISSAFMRRGTSIILSIILLSQQLLFPYTIKAQTSPIIFQNGFEEGDTSAYPQPNIDVAAGNTLEVTTNHPRTGQYSLEVSTGGQAMPSVIDQLFTKRNTIYQRTYISLPSDYTLSSGAVQNAIVLKTDDFRNLLWVVIGDDYRLSPVYFNSDGTPTFSGGFGTPLPRDGSWHEIQTRHTIDQTNGHTELWLDGTKIAEFTGINTGIPGRDDIHVVTWGSYFSTVSNNNRLFFDDVAISSEFITSPSAGFVTNVLAEGLELPTYAVTAPDGRIFIAEKSGVIKVLKNGAVLPTPLVTIPNVNTFQDRGLLSIAIDPQFSTNGYLYAAYTHDVNPTDFEGAKTARVIRLTVSGDTASLGTMQTILGTQVGTPENPSCDNYPDGTDCIPSDARTHSIGGLVFMTDGTLLISTGEGAPDINVNDQALRSQNLDSLGGKILRINKDGTAPSDNPFFNGSATANRSKVWAYGFRNPFRFSQRGNTDVLYAGDVGWGSWEEINVVNKGQNYGWPCYEGNEYLTGYSVYTTCQQLQASGTAVGPIYTYPHPPSSAAVGGTFYTGDEYPTEYRGSYFFGDYGQSVIQTLRVNSADELVTGSISSFPVTPDGPVQIFSGENGDIYYLSIYTGQLRRISYVTTGLPPSVSLSATPTSGPLPLAVTFSSDGTTNPGGGVLAYNWDFGDSQTSTLPNTTHTYSVAGNYTATLRVTNDLGIIRSKQIVIYAGNSAPSIAIGTPNEGTLYSARDTISFSAFATDPEDGSLSASNFDWNIIVRHCEVTTNTCHTHPFLSGSGNTGNFTAPDHGEGTNLELTITATDSQGLSTSQTRILSPRLVNISFVTSPSGIPVTLNGHTEITPFSTTVLSQGENSLSVPLYQTINNKTYAFSRWSNNAARNQTFSISTDASMSASYEEITESQKRTWNSGDVTLLSGSTQGTITSTTGSISASLQLYESSNDNGVDSLTNFTTYHGTNHTEGFNNLSSYWASGGVFGDYPYIGKNATSGNIQYHSPENEHLTTIAINIPQDGHYQISNLSARRVLGWGNTSTLKVFNSAKGLIASILANSTTFNINTLLYDVGYLTTADKLYFAVDRDGDFVGDATEATFRVELLLPDSPVIDSFTSSGNTLTWSTTNATQVTIDQGIGTVAADGSFAVSPTQTTTYTLTATGPGGSVQGTQTITVSQPLSLSWNSYDLSLTSSSTILPDSTATVDAQIDIYESANNDGVDLDTPLSTFRSTNHPEGFNDLSHYRTRLPGDFGEYPYLGKSATGRSMSFGETNSPSPLGVNDIQIHTPENDHLIVMSFVAPRTGIYSINNLSIRRVLPWGNTSTMRVFDSTKSLVTSLTSSTSAWNNSLATFALGNLTAGERIYIALDRDGDFVGDATEIAWTINYTQ